MTRELVETFLAALDDYEWLTDAQRDRWRELARSLASSASDEQIDELLDALRHRPTLVPESATEALVGVLLTGLVKHARDASRGTGPFPMSPRRRDCIVLLYKHLGQESRLRELLLNVLAIARSAPELAALAELMVTDPPRREEAVAVALTPLFHRRDYDPEALFPRLLDGISHRHAAAVILDLANFVVREGLASRHPGSDRVERLRGLLAGLAQRLAWLEENPEDAGDDVEPQREVVSQSVALAVSICDAIALIGDKAAVGALNQALEVGHRRLRTEAAAALAKLGEPTGRNALLDLAAEPVARLRVLAYAEELGLTDQIDDRFKTSAARAEADLVLWLAQHTQFGIPPTHIELVHQRSQYWPSYDDPQECYLFRYTYQFGERQFSNIGIAGPLTHTFAADLGDLPPDDLYAAFAGWQTEHAEIYEMEVDRLSREATAEIARLERRLRDAGLSAIQPTTLGVFFGERVLVAAAEREHVAGWAIADSIDWFWHPQGDRLRPLGPNEVYSIYKGRKLLREFNN